MSTTSHSHLSLQRFASGFWPFCLRGARSWSAALLIPINVFSFKVGWPVTGFIILALLGWRNFSLVAWGLVAASRWRPAGRRFIPSVLAPEDTAFMFSTLNSLNPIEDNPFAGPPPQIVLFVGGLAFAFWRLTQAPRRLVTPIGSVLAGSAVICVAGGLYLTLGGPLVRVPVAVLLSPARAMELASLLIYLLVVLWIARTPILGGVDRTVLMLAVMMLRGYSGWPLDFLARGPRPSRVCACRRPCAVRGAARRPSRLRRRPFRSDFSEFALGRGADRLVLRHERVGTANSLSARSGYWISDSRLSGDTVSMLKSIAVQPEDRRILFVVPQGDWTSVGWNTLVRKSGIRGDLYYLPAPNEVRAQAAKNATAGRIVDGLRSGQVGPADAAAFACLQATLVVPSAALAALPGWELAKDFGAWKELRPPVAEGSAGCAFATGS